MDDKQRDPWYKYSWGEKYNLLQKEQVCKWELEHQVQM